MSEQGPHFPEWRRLFRIARSLIDQVNEETTVIDRWALGGGTAMMLQIDHRDSRDIDIFLPKPEFLAFLNPDTRDLAFDVIPDGYEGDGTGFRKFRFRELGEIDFIVAADLTDSPTVQWEIEGIPVLLETVGEIVTKKVFHRGTTIKPRDIFDIAAAGRVCRGKVVEGLRRYREQTKAALATIEGLNPEFVESAISGLMIREGFADLKTTAVEKAKALLSSVVR